MLVQPSAFPPTYGTFEIKERRKHGSKINAAATTTTTASVAEDHFKAPCCFIIPPHMEKKVAETKERENSSSIIANAQLRTSTVLRQRRQAAMQLNNNDEEEKLITIYDLKHGDQLPGKLIERSGSCRDIAVKEAFAGAQGTYSLFREVYKRNSIDGNNMKIKSSVHFLRHYNNAFWEGSQMVYGDGEPPFNRFTADLDISGHELTHGIIQYTCNLEYRGQSGALNESIADVFGIQVKQRVHNLSANESNWKIGENTVLGDNYCLRSMSHPGTAYINHPVLGDDPQPASFDAFVETPEDYGGVHINSGIPNRAFYLVATRLGGYSWEKAGQIWYKTLPMLKSRSTFNDFAQKTIAVAGQLYGIDSAEQIAVVNAWKETKVRM